MKLDVQVFFGVKERSFIRYWTGMWSIACAVATLFTILTFIVRAYLDDV